MYSQARIESGIHAQRRNSGSHPSLIPPTQHYCYYPLSRWASRHEFYGNMDLIVVGTLSFDVVRSSFAGLPFH